MGRVTRSIFLFVCLMMVQVSCFAAEQGGKLVVLFTTDLHSQVLSHKDGTGGLVKIATIVERQRLQAQQEGAAFLLLDGGDIAMGSVFHTLFAAEAVEYRALARIGYDAFTYGNHDFDFGVEALQKMFSSAHSKDSLLQFPKLLSSNIKLKKEEQTGGGSVTGSPQSYALFNGNGVKTGVFGVMGWNSWNVIGKDSDSLIFYDPIETSRAVVEELKAMGAEYIIAISHGGALGGDDIKLAKKVAGIDFIISAHDHQLLHYPIEVNGTHIGAAGAYGEWVGKAVFNDGILESYTLLQVGEDVAPHPGLKQWADSMYCIAGRNIKDLSGIKLDDTLALLGQDSPKFVDEEGMMQLGSNIAAAYVSAAGEMFPDFPKGKMVGIVPYGVVRKGLHKGAVTGRDAFEVISLGENESGYCGWPLVYAFLTGKELQDLCEMTVSVAPHMEDVRLFFSGIRYRYNNARLPFARVDRVMAGEKQVCADSLYMVVTGSYTAALIGLLEKESFGLLSAQAKDWDGNPLLPDKIPCLRTPDGKQIPEWVAFAKYLRQGIYNPNEGADSIENDDFVPLGYTLSAIALCALLLWRTMRRRR